MGEVPCQGQSSLWPLALRKYPHPVSRTAAAASCGLRQRGMVGRVFPKDQDLDQLPFGHGTREHPVSNIEASWIGWVKGSCGVSDPALQHWVERVEHRLLDR